MRRTRGTRTPVSLALAALLALLATSRTSRAGDESKLEDPFATSDKKDADKASDEQKDDAPKKSEEAPPAKASKPPPPPRLDDTSTKRAALDFAMYADTDHVTVFTPSISTGIENVTQGASINGRYLVDVVSAASADIVSTASKRWTRGAQRGRARRRRTSRTISAWRVGGSRVERARLPLVGGGASADARLRREEHDALARLRLRPRHRSAARDCTSFSVFSRIVERDTFNFGVIAGHRPGDGGSLRGDLVFENGDQSKPYRYIPMFTPGGRAHVPNGASDRVVTRIACRSGRSSSCLSRARASH